MATQPPLATGAPPAANTAPFSWNIFANLATLTGLSAVQAVQWLDQHWFRLARQIMIYAGGLLILALFSNSQNLFVLNGWLGLGIVFIGTVTLLSIWTVVPGIVATQATAGAPALINYLRGVAHVMLLVGMVFLVLSMVKIYSFLALGIFFLALMLVGYWTLAYLIATGFYAKTTLVVLSLALVVSGVKAMTYMSPQAQAFQTAMQNWDTVLSKAEVTELEALQGERMDGGLTAVQQLRWNELQDKERSRGFIASVRARLATLHDPVKKEYRITTLQPMKLGSLEDLPDGCYTFKSEGPTVMVGTEPWLLYADVRLNGERTGDSERASKRICIDALSPPVLSFALGLPANMPLPQTIGITFTWAP